MNMHETGETTLLPIKSHVTIKNITKNSVVMYWGYSKIQ